MTHRTRILTVLTGVLVLFVTTVPVQATSFTAGTAADLIQAINDANDEAANPGADTITLTADITLDAVDNTADIDGNGSSDGNNGLPVISSEIIIEGDSFTIARSTATGTPTFRILGVLDTGKLTLNNVILRNGLLANSNPFNLNIIGGTIYNNGRLIIRHSTLSDNTSQTNGGAIGNTGTLTIQNSIISDNSATFEGGGIFNRDGTVTLSNSTVSNNEADRRGGGIFNEQGTLTIKNSIISNNSATSEGGGIYNRDGTMTISDSTFSGNIAQNDFGGAIVVQSISGTIIRNTLFSGNIADRVGGGILNDNGDLTVSNSTFSANSAEQGGGIFNFGDLTVTNSTLSGNISESAGGGIYNEAGTTTLSNSIIAASTDRSSGLDINECVLVNGTLNVNSSLDDDNSCTGTGSTITPGTDYDTTLADNGGPTQTHALPASSLAIDASDPATATTTDQRGAPAVNTRDIGAYEFSGAVPTVNYTITGTTLTEGSRNDMAVVTLTARNVNEPFDVRFILTGDAADDDYFLIGYVNPLTITSDVTRTFGILLVDDAINESTETLNLEMQVVGTVDIAGSISQVITFIDDDGAGVDVNGDGIVSPSDAIYVLNHLGTGDTFADINGDNTVDMTDYNAVINALGTSVP